MTSYDIMDALNYVDDELLAPVLTEKKPRRLKSSVKIAVAVAAAILLLLTAAIAAGDDGFISKLFGESYDIIGDYVMMEPVSVENEYARLTVESALSDGFNAYLIYSIERLDGGTLDDMYTDMQITPRYDIQWYAVPGGSWGEEFKTGEETPQKKWYLWCRSGNTGLESIDLRLLGVYHSETREKTDFGELRIDVPMKQSPVKLAANGGDPMGRDVFSKIMLSPIGFRMDAWPNLAPLTTDGSGETQRNGDYSTPDCTVVLQYKDGTETDISPQLTRRMDGENDYISAFFEMPVDIDKIDAVIINGINFELEYGTPERLRMSESVGHSVEIYKQYVYGEHEPLYPQISAQGERATLSVESIWTDGGAVEMFLYTTYLGESGTFDALTTFGAANSYLYNGLLEFRAYDKRGGRLGVAVERMNGGAMVSESLLCGYIVTIGGAAETLTIGMDGAEITIPLNMKKLGRLPQSEPYVEPPKEKAESKTDAYQVHYGHLFDYRTPDKVDISADNGEYSITVEYLWQMVNAGSGKLKAMIRCEQVDGGEYEQDMVKREVEIGVVSGGEYRAATSVDGGFSSSWFEDNVRYVAADIDYKFPGGERDAVRLTWTPPSGARISIDISVE